MKQQYIPIPNDLVKKYAESFLAVFYIDANDIRLIKKVKYKNLEYHPQGLLTKIKNFLTGKFNSDYGLLLPEIDKNMMTIYHVSATDGFEAQKYCQALIDYFFKLKDYLNGLPKFPVLNSETLQQ